MRLALLVFVLSSTAAVVARGEEWTPPKNPNPDLILREAQADARAKRYETALAKHVWFHKHALEYQPSQAGVRLSFALSYWLALGEAYPPALDALKEIREETQRRVTPREGRKVRFEDFHDLASLNREFGEEKKTVAAFKLIDQADPKMAKRVFGVSQPALIKAKEYELCGKYIDVDKSVKQVAESYRRMRQLANDPRFGVSLRDHATKSYLNEAATLVAILAVNDRLEDAADAVAVLKHAEGDDAFQAELATALDDALDGMVPEPWP